MAYYNTLPTIDNRQLLMFERAAETCKLLVLDIFQRFPNTSFTPYETYQILVNLGRSYPKDSVKRSITDLTTEGVLIKTGERRKGQYHVFNNCWKLNPNHK